VTTNPRPPRLSPTTQRALGHALAAAVLDRAITPLEMGLTLIEASGSPTCQHPILDAYPTADSNRSNES
jgi:hypothetical protein